MSWISPTFGDDNDPSTSAPKKRKTNPIPESYDCSSSIMDPASVSKSSWLQKYCPKNESDLAVSARKLKELEIWLNQCTKSRKKILVLNGPSGCCKTTAVQVLCRRLRFNIQEWITPLDKPVDESDFTHKSEFPRGTAKQFEEYLFRSSRYGSCLCSNPPKRLVLVKDFPNVFIHNPSTFHDILETILYKCFSPILFICSDKSICRQLFPDTLQNKCGIQIITFNPIPDQRLIQILKNILQQECKINKNIKMLPDESFHAICSASQGDLRNAISKLFFSSINSNLDINKTTFQKRLPKGKNAKESLPTDKDKKIDFFHGIGRVLYPKKIDSVKELKFVHSTENIVETFLGEPNKFISLLYENYPSKLGNVYDLSNAAEKMSKSDILMSRWQEKDIFHAYSLSMAVQGLMVTNKNPQKAKFEPFKKSQTSRLEMDSKSLQLEGKSIFSEFCVLDYESLLDILSFSTHLLPNLNEGQLEYVQKVCHFK